MFLLQVDYYDAGGGTVLPLRWAAPDSMQPRDSIPKVHMRNLNATHNLWSAGIVVWEVATLGQWPYALMDDDEVLDRVVVSRELHGPANATETAADADLLNVAKSCWVQSQDINAELLVNMLKQILMERNDTSNGRTEEEWNRTLDFSVENFGNQWSEASDIVDIAVARKNLNSQPSAISNTQDLLDTSKNADESFNESCNGEMDLAMSMSLNTTEQLGRNLNEVLSETATSTQNQLLIPLERPSTVTLDAEIESLAIQHIPRNILHVDTNILDDSAASYSQVTSTASQVGFKFYQCTAVQTT